MKKTEIYFIYKEFEKDANLLEEWFPSEQYVIDYNKQGRYSLKLRNNVFSGRKTGHMINLGKKDLVILIGNDYDKILSLFD